MKIIYTPIFVRTYKRLPKVLQAEIRERIDLFVKEPNYLFLKTHKLKGNLKDRWSFSVNYRYRIVFRYIGKDEVVLLAVGDHSIYD